MRRARTYAQNIAGSPSPIRKIVTKGTFNFEISPEKAEIELRQQPAAPQKAGKQTLNGKKITVVNSKSKSKAAAAAAAHLSMVTPDKSMLATHQRSITKVGGGHSRGASGTAKKLAA